MYDKLKYIDETDKSLGIAGMAITLVACDCEDMLACVSLEDGEESISMAEEFFFNGNPRLSAKIAWNEILKQFQVTAGMLIGNVLCRKFCKGTSPEDLLKVVHDIIIEEGARHCSLDEDEADAVYNKNYLYYNRLFMHPTVAGVARDFATALRMQRRMTSGEVIENLRRLGNI